MKNGILVPALVVRATLGVLALAMTAVAVAELPEAWRYYKMKRM